MAGNKKPRKQHRHRAVDPKAGLTRLQLAAIAHIPTTDGGLEGMELAALSALEAITKGHGSRDEWDSLARALNHAQSLADNGIGSEAIPEFRAAREAMRRCGAHYRKTGNVMLDGPGIQEIREALAYWRDQLRISTVGQVVAASKYVENEYRRALA